MKTVNIKQLAYTSVAALLLAACTSDELTDGTVQDRREPDGGKQCRAVGSGCSANTCVGKYNQW